MKFVIDYTETEPQNVNWSPFISVQDAKSTAERLDDQLAVLCAPTKFNMAQVHRNVQRQIVTNGTSFIGLGKVSMVRDRAVIWDAKVLSTNCDTFLKFNGKVD
jgi:hypothetical protein